MPVPASPDAVGVSGYGSEPPVRRISDGRQWMTCYPSGVAGMERRELRFAGMFREFGS
jgi:hypothetical protein